MSTVIATNASPAASATGCRPGQPLISLTIPTWNRAAYLAESLEHLLPQFAALPERQVELLISDNCSPDNTSAVVDSFIARGLPVRYVRNETNIGSDANFMQCVRLATGQYVWVLGDDDILLPGALTALVAALEQHEVDVVYLSSAGFTGNFGDARLETRDKFHRFAELVTDGAYFLEKVNSLIGLISVILINKNRLQARPHPPFESLRDTNLMQMSWVLPLVQPRMQVLFVWERLLAYRCFNSVGWGACEVFGVRLHQIARRYLPGQPQLVDALTNGTLRYWMCDSIMSIRSGQQEGMHNEDFAAMLQPLFGTRWRYWVFVWPVASLPLPLAKLVYRGLRVLNRFNRIRQAAWRHLFSHGRYLPRQGVVS